jgi:ferritin-like metal-binding protein YciE
MELGNCPGGNMKLKSFDDLFSILITDCSLIEEQNLNLLPKMIQKAQSSELKRALEKHHQEAKQHSQRVQKMLKESKVQTQKVEWESPLKSVFQSASKFLDENSPSPLLDAAIITIVQQIEHLEIAHYGTLREYADITERHELKELLKSTLKEEKATDSLLIRLARESGLNIEAVKTHA